MVHNPNVDVKIKCVHFANQSQKLLTKPKCVLGYVYDRGRTVKGTFLLAIWHYRAHERLILSNTGNSYVIGQKVSICTEFDHSGHSPLYHLNL